MNTELTGQRTLLDLFFAQVAAQPDRDALLHVEGDKTVAISWREWEARARTLAAGLLSIGLEPGARVVILSRTRVEWAWIDVAIMLAGGISVPVFPTELPATCAARIEDSGARIAIAEDPWQLKKLLEITPELEHELALVLITERMTLGSGAVVTGAEFGVSAQRTKTLSELSTIGRRLLEAGDGELDERIASARPDACVTICYTPGTEGRSKGVMLTHANFTTTTAGLAASLPVTNKDVQLLYLPLAQAFARIGLAFAIEIGMTVAFARSYRTVFEDCKRFQPTFICGVPRLYEKAQELVEADLRIGGGMAGLAASWVLDPAVAAEGGLADEGFFSRMRRDIGHRVVKRELGKHFGKKLRFAVSGSAPLGPETARFFTQHGIRVVEGYGMVETCAASHVNHPDDHAPGTVGQALPDIDVKLLPDGELLVRGPNVTPGYWGQPAETAKVMDAEGYFHTGDLARLDDDGRLIVTGRKRDIIVTANGKAIAPQPIVEGLRADPLIGQVLIYGDRRPFLSALLSLAPKSLRRFADEAGISGEYEALTRHPAVFARVEATVDRVNASLPPHENIKKFAILASGLTTEAGDLTPTQSLRRQVATEKHRALLDSFYSEQY